ncbi:hypothetical protein [Methylobacterium indicum]|uniref:hypothetical protein n=1 Tax=Methylobacterium indicum TaxID=1775910 RepID=UPI000AE88899|nr:hypothetical protein [Methylobacterium indicum]
MKPIAVSILLWTILASWPARADCLRDRGLACLRIEQIRPDATRGGVSASEFCAASAVIECGQVGSRGGRGPEQGPPDRNHEIKRPDYPSPSRVPQAQKPNFEDRHASAFAIKNGWIKISTGSIYGEKPEIKPYIKYNENLIEEFQDEYLSVDGFVPFEGGGVLLYSTNPGGSGTLNSHGLIYVDENGRIYRAAIPAGYERFEYLVGRGRISFELGIDNGQEVRAVFANGQLNVSKTPVKKGDLRDDDCSMLYNGVLEECARQDQKSCSYGQMMISMANQRPVNLLAYNNPNYRDTDLKLSCEQACREKRKPSFSSFRRAVCQSK